MKSFILSFVSKKTIARIAIEVLQKLVNDSKSDLDDKVATPVIQAIKDRYDI